ncbi:MAG: hypothetical protein R2706_07420 [Acidimicrobiales bacterium]
MLIVRLEESRRRDVASAVQNLRNSGAKNIALVLVGGRTKSPTYYGTSGEKNTAVGPANGQPTLAPISRRQGANRNAPRKSPSAPQPARAANNGSATKTNQPSTQARPSNAPKN